MFRSYLVTLLSELQTEGFLPPRLDFQNITLEPTKDPRHGELATNAALVLAKEANKSPRDIAEKIQEKLSALKDVEKIEIAGPGFINLTLSPDYWQRALLDILTQGHHFGESTLGQGIPLNIEYVSANPTGPLHAGHGRVAIVADVIANLLAKVGFSVTREYYINDTGGQIDVLARSTFLRYKEVLGETITIPEGYYPGLYLKDVAENLVAQEQDVLLSVPEAEALCIAGDFAVRTLMEDIRSDLQTLGIFQDVFTSEQGLHDKGAVKEAVEALRVKNLVYEGSLEKPKCDKEAEAWKPASLLLFKSTDFGDSSDRPLTKANGDWTYFAGDIAYHQDKIKRGFSSLIDVWGADHASHVDRMNAAVKALSPDVSFSVILAQMVHFTRGGEPLKMSKRAGTFVTVRDIVEQIGSDVFRFLMVSRKHDSQFTLDLDDALAQSKDNPVFYVQYAHARACSVLRAATALFPDISVPLSSLTPSQASLLIDDAELFLIKGLADWPRQVEKAAITREPHRIVNFLYDLAHRFHTLWNKGKKETILRFIVTDNKELSIARLGLIQALMIVVSSGLNLLGVKPIEEMR